MAKRVQLGVEFELSTKNSRDIMFQLQKGLSQTTKGWMREIKKDIAETLKVAVQATAADGATVKAWNKLVASPILQLHEQIKKAQLAGNAKLAQQLQHQLREQRYAYEREIKAREAAEEEILKRRRRETVEQIDDMKEGMEGIASSIFDGKSFADQIITQLRSKGGLLSNIGKFQQGKAAELAQKGGPAGAADAQRMNQIGKALSGLGKSLMVIGAIGASLIMLVKLFMDLESKVKDYNKAITASAGASDFGLSQTEIQMGALSKRLEEIRDNTTAVNDNFLKFRVGVEEQNSILAAFNQAGLTFGKINDQIQEGREFMESYSDATAIAATYARNLGESTESIAQQMGTLSFETGDHLQSVAEQFSLITRESMAAGFSTKRFYSTVLEATSGMAFYGVRISEAALMLKNFDSLLGEAVGSELYKNIVGKGKDMSAQDRIREIILNNPQYVAEQYGKAFERSLEDLSKKFGKPGGPLAGIDIGKLLKLDEVDLQKELQKAQMTPEQITQFLNARLLQRAATGDLAAMTEARGVAGPGFDIAMAGQATGVFGNKRIDEVFRDISAGKMGAEGFAALEQATGKSQDELMKLSRTFSAAEAYLQNLTEIREKIAKGEQLSEEDIRVQEQARDKLGLYIDQATGKLLRGQFDSNKNLIEGTGVAVEDAMDVVTAQATTPGEDAIKEQLTKDQEIASEISKNITGLTEIMQQSVAAILNDIYDVLVDFYRNWLGDTGLESQRLESIQQAHETRIQLEKRIEGLEQERNQLMSQRDAAQKMGDEMKAKELTKQIEALDASIAKSQKAQVQFSKVEEDIKTMEATGKGLETGLTSAREVGLIDTISTRSVQTTIDQLAGEEKLIFSGGGGMADVGERIRENFENLDAETQKGLLDLFGGIENFEKAILEAEQAFHKATEDAKGWEKVVNPMAVRKAEAGAAKAAFEQTLFRGAIEKQLGPEATQVDITREILGTGAGGGFASATALDILQGIEKNTKDTKDELESPFGGILQAQDLILPAGGGRPIMTDPADTLMAFKPGGPISKSMGGGGNTTIHFNLLGSPKENAQETLRILKELGVTS